MATQVIKNLNFAVRVQVRKGGGILEAIFPSFLVYQAMMEIRVINVRLLHCFCIFSLMSVLMGCGVLRQPQRQYKEIDPSKITCFHSPELVDGNLDTVGSLFFGLFVLPDSAVLDGLSDSPIPVEVMLPVGNMVGELQFLDGKIAGKVESYDGKTTMDFSFLDGKLTRLIQTHDVKGKIVYSGKVSLSEGLNSSVFDDAYGSSVLVDTEIMGDIHMLSSPGARGAALIKLDEARYVAYVDVYADYSMYYMEIYTARYDAKQISDIRFYPMDEPKPRAKFSDLDKPQIKSLREATRRRRRVAHITEERMRRFWINRKILYLKITASALRYPSPATLSRMQITLEGPQLLKPATVREVRFYF